MNFGHCKTFEQLAKEGPIEELTIRELSDGNLHMAIAISEWYLRCGTYDEAVRKAKGQ